jgi:hypothetical protein
MMRGSLPIRSPVGIALLIGCLVLAYAREGVASVRVALKPAQRPAAKQAPAVDPKLWN